MIILDYKDRRPIYEQVVERFKELIMLSVLKAEEQLPSVRNLAMELSINPNTIQRAYAELERLGIVYCIKGKGNFVAESSMLFELKREELDQFIKDLIKKADELNMEQEELINGIKACYRERQVRAGSGLRLEEE